MNLTLQRTDETENAIFGSIDALKLFTLENKTLAIPAGTYKCTRYDSPKHGKVFLLNNVPGNNPGDPPRTYIEIHAANEPHELLGCIAVGKYRGLREEWIYLSGRALETFMEAQEGCDEFELEVRDL